MALLGELKLYIPLAGLIDKDAEKVRLTKEREKLSKDLAKSETKLANANFVDKAPAAVVEKEKVRVEEVRAAITRLEEQFTRLD
jgi:valyl-tRNA synthetase